MKTGHHALAALVAAFVFAGRALAHVESDAFLDLRIDGSQVNGSWQASVRDLEYALDLDANEDGVLTTGEWSARRSDVVDYFKQHVVLTADGRAVTPEIVTWSFASSLDGLRVCLGFSAAWPVGTTSGSVAYHAFFADDARHRGHVSVTMAGRKQSALLSPERPRWEFATTADSGSPGSQSIQATAGTASPLIAGGAAAAALGLFGIAHAARRAKAKPNGAPPPA